MLRILLPLLFMLVGVKAEAQAATRNGRDYTVFFVAGIYDNGWSALCDTPAKAQYIASELRERYGFKVKIAPDIVQLLSEYKQKKYNPIDSLILVRGGTFTMGCTSEQQDCLDHEKPTHAVTLSDFYIGQHEVTQKLWVQVMGSNPSGFKGDDLPVENVSWNDVQDFLKKLNAKLPAGQKPYRLPTEAEWEYAARQGGQAVLFGNGKNIADPAEINFGCDWIARPYSIHGIARKKTTPVGSFAPNNLGLFDMSGNVWEWCSDRYGDYSSGNQTNPTGPASGVYRIARGCGCSNDAQHCRVAYRHNATPTARYSTLGFRLARSC